jgi:hypothetical protein
LLDRVFNRVERKSVDTSRVGVGEMIAGISALALFIFMFLPWFGLDSVDGFGLGDVGIDASAWEAFSFIDILLFLVVVVVLGLVLASAAASTPDLPQPPATIIAGAGAIALVLVLFRLIFPPGVDGGFADIDVDLGREIGVFLGLIASAGITYGGWRAMNEAGAPNPPQPGPPAGV